MKTTLVHLHSWDRQSEDRANLFHRIERPCALLNRDGRFDAMGITSDHPDAPAMAYAADILVLHVQHDMALEALIDWRREHGKATLYEIADDMSAPAPWRKKSRRSPLILSDCFHLASRCAGLQFSSEALERKYAILSSCRQVLPNLIEIPARLPKKPPGFTVGWAGTRSHREDLRPMVRMLRDLLHRRPEIQLALKGDLEMLHELFGELPADQLRFEDFGSPASYEAFLHTLHVGLIPLAATAFNAGRTDVKLFEYAAAGIAAVVQGSSAYAPHLKEVLCFQDLQELETILEKLYLDPEELHAERERCHSYALSRNGFASGVEQHAAWYLSHAPSPENRITLPAQTPEAIKAMEAFHRLMERDLKSEANLEEALRTLDRYPNYLQLRLLVVRVLVATWRLPEAIARVRPLLASMYRDRVLMIALSLASTSEQERLRGYLRSAAGRARSVPFQRENPSAFAWQVLRDVPFDYFSLMLCSRVRSTDLSEAQRQEIQQKVALFSA